MLNWCVVSVVLCFGIGFWLCFDGIIVDVYLDIYIWLVYLVLIVVLCVWWWLVCLCCEYKIDWFELDDCGILVCVLFLLECLWCDEWRC